MTKLLLSTSNIMSGGPSVIRRTPFTKSNAEFTNSLRANFRAAWESSDDGTDGTNGTDNNPTPAATASSSGQAVQRPADYKRWTRQDGDTVWIPAVDFSDSGLAGQRAQYDITVKLFFLQTTDTTQHRDHVHEAIGQVLKELHVPGIDLLIMSFAGVTFDADDDMEPSSDDDGGGNASDGTPELRAQMDTAVETWRALEELQAAGTVAQLGLAEFGSERLKRFLPRVRVRPSLDQINVRDCCVVPKSLITYAKQEGVELMTHNDSTNILPKGTIRDLLGDGPAGAGVLCTDPSGSLCGEVEPQWVVKYTAVVKDRGVVENKGYFAMANLLD